MPPEIGAGSAGLSIVSTPTFENSGQCASSVVPKFASASEHESLPSAAFGLIENPSGSFRVAALISDGDGKLGLNICGTVRSMSTPEAESAAVVVGLALRLGLKVSWSHPVGLGQGAVALLTLLSYPTTVTLLVRSALQTPGLIRNGTWGCWMPRGCRIRCSCTVPACGCRPPGTPHNFTVNVSTENCRSIPSAAESRP